MRLRLTIVFAAGFMLVLLLFPGHHSDPPALRFKPPAAWEQVYHDVWRDCRPTTQAAPATSWQEVEWYLTETDWFLIGVQWAVGFRHHNRIYVGPSALQDPELFVVRHEMLHALLKAGGHPPAFTHCGLHPNAYHAN